MEVVPPHDGRFHLSVRSWRGFISQSAELKLTVKNDQFSGLNLVPSDFHSLFLHIKYIWERMLQAMFTLSLPVMETVEVCMCSARGHTVLRWWERAQKEMRRCHALAPGGPHTWAEAWGVPEGSRDPHPERPCTGYGGEARLHQTLQPAHHSPSSPSLHLKKKKKVSYPSMKRYGGNLNA